MPGFEPLENTGESAGFTATGGVRVDQLYRAVLDGDEARIRALLSGVLGVSGRLLLERQRAQLDIFESLLAALRREALLDGLTGVYNRRGFQHLGARLLEDLARTRRAAHVVYADVDDFKRVNDTAGHSGGNRHLRDVTAVLAQAAGPAALIGRLGGDEFAMIVPLDTQDDEPLPERIRSVAAACNAQRCRLPLSLSVGVAPFDPLQPAALPVLLEQADRAMYLDKTGKFRRRLRVQTLNL